jgi:UDP-glucuronate 4-epimerase
MRIFITGICGFVGYNLATKLISEGHEVTGIDALTTSYTHKVHRARHELLKSQNVPVMDADLLDVEFELISERLGSSSKSPLDAIIHLAAWPGVLKSKEEPKEYFRNNVAAFARTLRLIEVLKPAKFIYASSSSVYGNLGANGPCLETSELPEAKNYYAETKKIGEMLANSYPFGSDTQVCGLRFFTVVGPWGRPDMSYWSFADCISADAEILLRGDNGGLRDFTDIDDLTGIITALISTEKSLPKILNISNSNPKSALEMIELIAQDLSKTPKIRVVPRSDLEADITIGSNDLLNEIIGQWDWKPLDQTIQNFSNWYLAHRSKIT